MHSYEVLGRLGEFGDLGRPLVVGPSRKGFLTRPLPREISATERDWPTAAAVTAAVMAGAHIVRVHAVQGNGSRRAGSRRNSEVSSRALMEWLPQLAQLLRRPAVSWWDVVDILLVSVLIYELLLLIRGTRAVQMALSAGFLIGLFFVSRWFDLETVNWVIRNLATYVGFAIIVLFQADIRRALAHFGRAPFFKYFERATSADESIEDLVVAASTLAARRIGAIIVIERQIGLRNYIEGGIPLDATITYDLLATIFQPGVAAARRRGDRAGRSHCRGRVFPAALDQSEGQPRARHTAPRCVGHHRRERRDCDRGLRRDWRDHRRRWQVRSSAG